MLSHADFGKLRLAQFLPADEIEDVLDYEFMERYWVGEASGFTEVLQLEDDPEITRSVALDLEELPPKIGESLLAVLKLPLAARMPLKDICSALGTQPRTIEQFVSDRKTYGFEVGDKELYRLSCTVLDRDGLIHLVVMRPN